MALIPRLPKKNRDKSQSASSKTIIPKLTGARIPYPQKTETEQDVLKVDDKGRAVFTVGAGFKQNSQSLALQAGLGPLRKEVADQIVPAMKDVAGAIARKPATNLRSEGAGPQVGKILTQAGRFATRTGASLFVERGKEFQPKGRLAQAVFGVDPISPEETGNLILDMTLRPVTRSTMALMGKNFQASNQLEEIFLGKDMVHSIQERSKSTAEVITGSKNPSKFQTLAVSPLVIGAALIDIVPGLPEKKVAQKVALDVLEQVAERTGAKVEKALAEKIIRDVEGVYKLKNVKARNAAILVLQDKYLKDAVANVAKVHPEDVGVIEKFLDKAGQGMKTSEQEELAVSRLVDRYGYGAGNTRASLRNAAEELLQDYAKSERPVIGSGQTKAGTVGKESTVAGRNLVPKTEPQNLGSRLETSQPVSKVSKVDTSLSRNLARSGEDVNPLLSEARKYKSAEEFVASQKKLLHGTNTKFDKFDISKSGDVQPSDWGQGAYFTDNVGNAKNFAKVAGGDIVMERYAPNVKYADGSKLLKDSDFMLALDDGMGFTTPAEYLAKKGYGGVVFKNPQGFNEYVVFNPDEILSKSQLTSIWEEANKGGGAAPQRAFSAISGIEMKRDEDGKLHFTSYDPVKGAIGLVAGSIVGQKLPEAMYAANRLKRVEPNVLKRMIKSASESFGEAGKSLDKILGTISTRLKNIDPTLKASLRKFEYRLGTNINRDRRVADTWLKGVDKLSDLEYKDLDLALKNGDEAKILDVVKKNGLEKEWGAIRTTLDDLYKRASDVGFDIGYEKNYFPRMVADSKGLLEHLAKGEDWSIIEQVIKDKEVALARILTDNEKAAVVNNLLRGYGTDKITLSKTGAMKARAIDVVDPEINKFYHDSADSLLRYIDNTNNAIEARTFFGKSFVPPKEVVPGLVNEAFDPMDSVGAYTLKLVADGKITPTQEKELRDILQARFSPKGATGAVRVYKNLSYIDTMGSVTSAITQLGDLAWAIHKAGPVETVKNLAKAVVGKSELRKVDLGIEKIAQEFESASKSATLVDKVFRVVGLNAMDNLGKETLINATMARFRRLANNPNEEFLSKLKGVFGNDEAAILRTMEDLKANKITEDTKLLAFNELLDVQPIALSEMPEQYLKAGNGRVFYMLKTFTIKQLDVYRNEVFQLMKTNPKRAIRNLVTLSASLMLMNATADEIKDFILGRETKLSDRVVDNVAKLAGFSKFTLYKARQQGVGSAVVQTILPPFKLLDSAYKDIAKHTAFADSETVQSIPLGGKLYYWWFGKGAQNSAKKANAADKTGNGAMPSLPSLGDVGLPSLDLGLPSLPGL